MKNGNSNEKISNKELKLTQNEVLLISIKMRK